MTQVQYHFPFESAAHPIPLPEGRLEWLEQRRLGIGGSEAATLMGHSDNGPISVFEAKVNPVDPDEALQESEPAYWGHKLEETVAQEFSLRTGYAVQPSKFMFRSKAWPWMLATVDRIVTEIGVISILECKTRSNWVRKQWDDGVPPGIKDQCYHYMAVTGVPRVWVAVLIGGQHFRVEVVDRDDDYVAELVDVERRFWEDHVLPRIPPPYDSSSGTRALVETKFAQAIPNKVVELPDEAAAIIQSLCFSKGTMDSFVEDREALKTRLKALLGDAEYGTLGGDVVVTWKQSRRSSVDTNKLKLQYPDVYKKVLRETGSRRFQVKGVEGEE